MTQKMKIPTFSNEAEEADWWYEHRGELSREFDLAAGEGRLRIRVDG